MKRDRITVTIRQDLLTSLDNLIDKHRIRNRSHALEVVLSRTFSNTTNQAVILASGQGVKMRPFTYEIPKPLIPVAGRPLLEHTIDLLKQHNITDLTITVSHLAEKIIDHFGDGRRFGVSITYIEEKQPSGTGGALKSALKSKSNDPFLLIYGDVLLDLDLTEFIQAHLDQKKMLVTLALTSVQDPTAWGQTTLRGNRIVDFSEKPDNQHQPSNLVFAGCAVINPLISEFLPKRKQHLSLETDVFPQLITAGKLAGYPFEGRWFDVSTPKIYEQVVKEWQ